ncbi:MAG: hypothetical protein ACHQNA_14290 [Acidimicrobiales bacterium]
MFVQVIQGQLADVDLWRSASQAWREQVKPHSTGFLGATSGITAGGYAITVARFESEAAARANSDRPEQGAWFEQYAKAYEGEITFHDCTDVDEMLAGGSDKAGFVQIMQARAKDPEILRGRDEAMEAELRRIRPDLIGGIVAWHGDGTFTQTSYFTSEAEARENEKTMSDSPMMEQFMAAIDGIPTFYDLTEVSFD